MLTPQPRTSGQPPAVIHVDLDGATDIFFVHGWKYRDTEDPLFETGFRRCLDLFEARDIRATFFVIASSLAKPRKRALIDEAVRRGHEIASHTVTHRVLRNLSSQDKRAELADSRTMIESALGVRVKGFRAPGYRIDRECYELLAELGYEYDVSAFPSAGFSKHLQEPVERLRTTRCPVDGRPFLAIPMPEYGPVPLPFSPSYVLLLDQAGLGLPHFRQGLKRFRRTERPFVFLFHLVDFADPLPRGVTSAFQRLFTLSLMSPDRKIALCERMLDQVSQHYRIVPTAALVAEARGGPPANV